MKYLACVKRVGVLLRQFAFDLVVVLLAIEGVLGVLRRDADMATTLTPRWAGAVAVVALVVPLLARRQLPFAAPLMVWLMGAVLSFIDGQFVVATFSAYAAGAAAAFLLGNLPEPARARLGLVAVLLGALVVLYNSPARAVSDFVTISATFAAAWLAGFVLRARVELAMHAEQRADAAERERESSARVAVVEERSRITRELHDVVAHAVSVMVLQVGAVRHRLPDSQSDVKVALKTVEDTGRSALTEMRRLLEVIHDDDPGAGLSPQPGLDHLDTLVEKVGLAGLSVRVHREGEPFLLPAAIDLSAFRILQEGLTNCLKHAAGTRADVTLRYLPGELRIEVVDDGIGPASYDQPGRGIMGMRERVNIFGGTMAVGAGPRGGFRLDVRLPVSGLSR